MASNTTKARSDEQANDGAIEDLMSLLLSGRAICLVGSGLSSAPPLAYPQWNELLTMFERFALDECLCDQVAVDLARNADRLEHAQSLKTLVERARPRAYEEF